MLNIKNPEMKPRPNTAPASDKRFMSRALSLAERGRGFTSPNPVAGACVVKKGRLISSGFHARFGGPHAEVLALRRAGRKARGGTLFVTLEPCSTFGKTPPCVDRIREAGVRRVVIGVRDPNPKHRGRAFQALRNSGIRVETSVLENKALEQNEAFFKWVQSGLPFVTLKMAQSLDGKIASRTGNARWISGPQARAWVHDLRAQSDAVLVGVRTVLRDNPRLTVRYGKRRGHLWRIVLDSFGQSSPRARIFNGHGPAILVCSSVVFKRVAKKFERTSVVILPVSEHGGQLDLETLLSKLGSLGITSLLVEGGGEVTWSFLERGLVDKVFWIVAPKLIGGRSTKTSVEGAGVREPKDAWNIGVKKITSLGSDILFEGYLN